MNEYNIVVDGVDQESVDYVIEKHKCMQGYPGRNRILFVDDLNNEIKEKISIPKPTELYIKELNNYCINYFTQIDQYSTTCKLMTEEEIFKSIDESNIKTVLGREGYFDDTKPLKYEEEYKNLKNNNNGLG